MASNELQDFKVCEDEKHDLECPICLFLVREAMEMPCSHLLCRECVGRLSLSTEETKLPLCCPLCKGNFNMSEIHRNTYADRMVRNVNVYCPLREHGCEWKGTIPTYRSKHEDVCEYKVKVCIHNGCSFSEIKKLFSGHEQTCPFRNVSCQYCDEVVQLFLINEHFGSCPQYPIHCINEKCEVVRPRNEMNEHIENECEFTIVNCTFYAFGCHQKFERRMQEDHNHKSTTNHMTFLCHQVTKVQHQNTQLQNCFNEIQKESDQSQKHVKHLENEMTVLKTENENQNAAMQKQIAEIEQLKKRICLWETRQKLAPIKNDFENLQNPSRPIVDINELLIKGANRWIQQKNIDFSERNYAAWFQKIFDLMEENRLYQCDNGMFIKIKTERRSVMWQSNSKKQQEVQSKSKDVIHKSDDGLVLRDVGILCIETETLPDFNDRNMSFFILHPHLQQNIFGIVKSLKDREYYCLYSSDISYDLYVDNFLVVCLLKDC